MESQRCGRRDYLRVDVPRGGQFRDTSRPHGAGPGQGCSATLTPGRTAGNVALVGLVLDLMRHGHALPATDGDDDRRRLSPRGREDLERLAQRLKSLGWRP